MISELVPPILMNIGVFVLRNQLMLSELVYIISYILLSIQESIMLILQIN